MWFTPISRRPHEPSLRTRRGVLASLFAASIFATTAPLLAQDTEAQEPVDVWLGDEGDGVVEPFAHPPDVGRGQPGDRFHAMDARSLGSPVPP